MRYLLVNFDYLKKLNYAFSIIIRNKITYIHVIVLVW